MLPPQWLGEAKGCMQGGDHTTCSGGAFKIDDAALGSQNKGGQEDGEGNRCMTPQIQSANMHPVIWEQMTPLMLTKVVKAANV